MPHTTRAPQAPEDGFTLVEAVVGIAIAVVILTAFASALTPR